MSNRRRFLALLGAAAVCTGTGAFAAEAVTVEIREYRFTPAEVKVPAGSTVKWVNREKRTTHTVRFTGPDAMESDRLFPDDTWERRFDRPGRWPYECGPHPEMKGWVIVE